MYTLNGRNLNFLQYIIFIPSPSGRSRHNILSALSTATKDIVTVNNDKYINGETVCAILAKLAARKCNNMPITVVFNNARYQRCTVVIEYARMIGIELLFLPSYSPNLNLIERLWKFVKETCLYSKYYDKFEKFKETIMDCLENISVKTMQKLETLLICEFQRFENVKISAV